MKIDILEVDMTKQPLPDIAICSQCGWRGPTDDCIVSEEGEYETGYYEIYLCPCCEDGGCIDDYDMTELRAKEWNEWYKKSLIDKENADD